MAAAMSSGSPRRRRGVARSMAWRMLSSVSTTSRAEVATEPTAMALTRMPRRQVGGRQPGVVGQGRLGRPVGDEPSSLVSARWPMKC